MSKKPRCPFHSRAWNCRCDLEEGHAGWCVSEGDAFAGGWDPTKETRKEEMARRAKEPR